MRVAVISCWKYRDAWRPFFDLFRKFWPQWDSELIDLITDGFDDALDWPMKNVYVIENQSWAKILASYAYDVNCDVLLVQEDFFLNAPVDISLIGRAVREMRSREAGMIRLYPCPGADRDYGDEFFGIVSRGSRYRVSCQASIWRSDYLHAIASRVNTPAEFEIEGTMFAETLPDEVLALKRDAQPWPLQYYCSAISRGLWEPAALEFCRQQGIEVDTSMRGVAS